MAAKNREILKRTVDALEKSFRRYPENEKILLQLAIGCYQLGRFDPTAIQVYQDAAERFPTDVKVQRALSTSYLVTQANDLLANITSMGEIDKASLGRNIEKLDQLSQEFDESPYIHQALADLLMINGDTRDAIHHYRCAMALGIIDVEDICVLFERFREFTKPPVSLGIFFAEIYQRIGLYDKSNELFVDLLDQTKKPERALLDKYGDFLRRRIDEIGNRDPAQLSQYIRQFIKILLLRGNTAEAITWAQQLTPGQVARDPELARQLSSRLIQMEDFRQAFEYLSKLPLDPPTKSMLNEIAMILEKRGELDTAVYILQYINDNDEFSQDTSTPEKPRPKAKDQSLDLEIEMELQMAERHWKNKRWDQSFESYLHVLELGFEDYKSMIEPLDLLIGRITEVTPDQLTFLTSFFAKQKDWRRTLNYALRTLKVDPKRKDMSQRVLQSCERLLIENPSDSEVRLLFGDEHLRLNHIERAISEYRRSSDNPEFKMKANRRLARAYIKAGDLNAALQHFKDLLVLEQEDLEKLYDLAIAFAADEQYKSAFETATLIKEYDANFRDIEAKITEYEERMKRDQVDFVLDPKMRELIGDHSIGRYKYEGKVGSGGMGVVHKVLDLKTNTIVAMKILREGLSSSGKAIDRFFREARIAATLHHPNIVNILDYNISNNYGQSFIAMEFVDGPSLRDVLEKKFAATVEIGIDDIIEALHLLSQLCDALDATHKKGIIHRDIKPDNIMIAPGHIVKITDFGIVHIEEATFTPTGALIGTPRYMSPEQVHGGRIDARSDIYAVGIILYEMLIGSPPFISGDISYQQVNVLPTPAREICPAIPAIVDQIINCCLEKSPSDRYQSALQCKREVDEAYVRLGGDPSKVRMTEVTDEIPEDFDEMPSPVSDIVELPPPNSPKWVQPPRVGDDEEEHDTLDGENQTVSSEGVKRHVTQTIDLGTDFDMDFPSGHDHKRSDLDSDLD